MPTLSTRQLAQRLERLEKEELVQEILKICSRFREAKQYCQMEFGDAPHQEALLTACKEKIVKHFFPERRSRRHRARTSRLKKITGDFKKIAVFPHHLADVLLCWPEQAVLYLEQRGYVKDTFFPPTLTAFEEACRLIADNDLHEYFHARIEALLQTAGALRGRQDFAAALAGAATRNGC
ncbi:MAG: hypothetical protein IT259_14505 [Saprospiraceae bacterium]|nr:hypothetical protein [Saprospiraceae bacterium]